MSDLPKFDAPPVVEVVLGLQFDSNPHLSAAHIGAFWQAVLRSDFPSVGHAHRLDDAMETFGEERAFKPMGIHLAGAPTFPRLQFTSADDERMIQIQDTRFVLNWRKRVGDYPSFNQLAPEFVSRFQEFQNFIADDVPGGLSLNQWEVTYVDHIPAGSLWRVPGDWHRISQSLVDPTGCSDHVLDTAQLRWTSIIGERPEIRGKLHIHVRHVKIRGVGPETLSIDMTARGPIPTSGSYIEAFDFAHEHLVGAFCGMTTGEAQAAWKRRT